MITISNRKKVAILTLLMLIINLFVPIIVNAEATTKLSLKTTADLENLHEGDEFTLNVYVEDLVASGDQITGAINFDSEKLQISGVTTDNDKFVRRSDIGATVDMCSWRSEDPDKIAFALSDLSAVVTEDEVTEGNLLKIKFVVKEGAIGQTAISLSNVKYFTIDYASAGETNYPLSANSSVTATILDSSIALESIAVSPKTASLDVGGTQQLSIARTPDDTTDLRDPEWTTSNANVATVDSNGLVTAVAPGEATITATIDNFTDTATISVSSHLSSITISPSGTINLETNTSNNTKQLEVTKVPANTTDEVTISYESSAPAVATVSPNGLITAVANGETTITVKATVEGEVKSTATVTVKVSTVIESISIGQESGSMVTGESKTLTLTVTPENASIKNVIWTSSDDGQLRIDSQSNTDCKFTAIGTTGNATITVSVTDETGGDAFTKTYTVSLSNPLQSISFDGVDESLTMDPGTTRELTIVYNPVNASDIVDATWESSDPTVATVSNGVITAIKPGNTTITARVGNKATSVEVTVNEIPLNSIVLNKETTSIEKGKTETLTYQLNPTNTTDPTDVIWTSSDPTVATVEDGVITALKKGTTTITVKIDGKETINDSCEVTVIVPLTDFTVSETNVTLNKGENKTIDITIIPEDTSDDTTATWTSGNASVATVDQNGKITAVAGGNAVVTVKIGNIEKTVNVQVIVPLESISIKSSTSLIKKQTETLTVTYNPTDTTVDKNVAWTSSDTSVATVDQNGKITAIKAGTTTITAKVDGKEARCVVTVTEKKLAGITIDNAKEKMYKNETLNLSVIFTPEDTTDDSKIVWSSSDESIATVDQNGKVTALKEGTVTIKATATVTSSGLTGNGLVGNSNGVFEDEVEIAVEEIHTESIEISTDNEDNKVSMGESLKINTKFTPENTTDSKKLIYTSSDESIAKVDENGNIIPVAPGTVSITVMTENGIKSQMTITVQEAEVTPEAEKGKKATDSPKTGDINIALYMSLMIISLGGLIYQRKKNK